MNDRYGHIAGDEAILSIVDILVSTVRQRDIVARVGGDEFGVVVEEISGSKSSVYGLAQRLVDQIQKQSLDHSTTASVGVHVFRVEELLSESKTPEEFEKAFYEQMIKADNATYSAKEAGKNQVQVSNEFVEYYKLESKASK